MSTTPTHEQINALAALVRGNTLTREQRDQTAVVLHPGPRVLTRSRRYCDRSHTTEGSGDRRELWPCRQDRQECRREGPSGGRGRHPADRPPDLRQPRGTPHPGRTRHRWPDFAR